MNICVCGTWEWPFFIPGALWGCRHSPPAQGYKCLCKAAPWGPRSPSNPPQDIVQAVGMCGFWAHWLWQQRSASHRLLWSKLWQHNPKPYTPAYGIQLSSKCHSLPLQAPPKPTFCSSECLSMVVLSARSRMAPIFQPFCLKLLGFFPISWAMHAVIIVEN